MRTIFAILILAFAALGADQLRPKDEDDAREAAFKTLVQRAGGAPQGYKVYFFSVGHTFTNSTFTRIDPTDEFMKRFAGRKPPIQKVSACKDTGEKVVDAKTGERGIIFTVSDLKLVGHDAVEATCSVYRAGLDMLVYKYTLTKKNNQWNVTKKELVSIS